MLSAGPAPDSTNSHGDNVSETGNALIFPTSSPQNPLIQEPLRRLTRDKLSAFAELSATTQNSPGVCASGSEIEPGLASARPLTRAKARDHAAKIRQHSTSTHISAQKTRTYSQKEDQLLKDLMRNAGRVEGIAHVFQRRFPDRSTASLRKRWLQIQPRVRWSTRSRLLRHVS